MNNRLDLATGLWMIAKELEKWVSRIPDEQQTGPGNRTVDDTKASRNTGLKDTG